MSVVRSQSSAREANTDEKVSNQTRLDGDPKTTTKLQGTVCPDSDNGQLRTGNAPIRGGFAPISRIKRGAISNLDPTTPPVGGLDRSLCEAASMKDVCRFGSC